MPIRSIVLSAQAISAFTQTGSAIHQTCPEIKYIIYERETAFLVIALRIQERKTGFTLLTGRPIDSECTSLVKSLAGMYRMYDKFSFWLSAPETSLGRNISATGLRPYNSKNEYD
ncbi:MAG: hypothetical protein WCJ01_06710 [Ignavibacteria bacterium]